MTHEQYDHPAHSSAINDPSTTFLAHQHAPVQTTKTTMSDHGLFENYYSSEHRLSGEWIMQDDQQSLSNDTNDGRITRHTITAVHDQSRSQADLDESYHNDQPTKRSRVHFYDFAAQARLQQYHARRKHLLQARKKALQKSIALSARLRRTSSWVQDGLVEISKHQDPKAFAQVFGHAQDLVDTCFSHWNNELNDLDASYSMNAGLRELPTRPSLLNQLPSESRNDLLLLLSHLRSNPQFLIGRLRTLPRSQVVTLTSAPKWQFSDTALNSFSQDSNRSGSQRKRQLQAYSKELEDYAMSFERSHPLSFLLHNLYGHDVRPESMESQLRLYNWSTICAELMATGADSYNALYGQVLEAFAVMQDWPAKTRIEIFLMDVLQRGAFLINDNPIHRAQPGYNPLRTEQAKTFLNDAVHDLYWTLIECKSGCFPSGALALAQAILGKLSSTVHQSDFRNHFYNEWYLGHFLKAAIMFPENENMLLKMHVSKKARELILAPIYNMFIKKFENFDQEPVTDQDTNIRNIIEAMINMLDGCAADNPYQTPQTAAHSGDTDVQEDNQMLVMCASEIIKVLEILSPQMIHSVYSSDPVMRSIGNAWEAQHPWPTTRFDVLKQQLLQLIEPGRSAKDIHPCLEMWAELEITAGGSVMPFKSRDCDHDSFNETIEKSLNVVQKAALRLCSDNLLQEDRTDSLPISKWTSESTLTDLFQRELGRSQSDTRVVDTMYWHKALESLSELQASRPFSKTGVDDTTILAQPFELLQAARANSITDCAKLDEVLGLFENAYRTLKKQVKSFMSSLEELRLKLWYTSQVINSSIYLDARNVASALSLMALPNAHGAATSRPVRDQTRPSTTWSSRSSIFGESQSDTMKLLKAPTEHGGPRKLADEQVENINSWLQQYSIDNFCIGEERLHRFCMEVQLVTKKLTGETMLQSPDLWSSELFVRERLSYDVHTVGISSAPASTRPGSIYSDVTPFTIPRSLHRSIDTDSRSVMSDERGSLRRGSVYNVFHTKLNPQLLPPELASSIGSYGRTSSANTTASDIFSQASQSVTSASVYSRASSVLYGSLPDFGSRPLPAIKEKKRFREHVRMGLVCLLLSDLGSMVWSWGCETDTWINEVQSTPSVQARYARRLDTKNLAHPEKGVHGNQQRRNSAGQANTAIVAPIYTAESEQSASDDEHDLTYLLALRDILLRMGKQVDPASKLQACVDFHTVALDQLDAKFRRRGDHQHVTTSRRRSLGGAINLEVTTPVADGSLFRTTGSFVPTETQIIDHLKNQLAALKPTTIFRDLQFTAVFAPPDMLDKKAAGKAFMHLGMALLEYKNELCGSIVDIADQIVAVSASDSQVPISSAPSLSMAAKYWRIAAIEGHRVAQRELALLYLMHPEMLQVVTLPLATSGDIFQDDITWGGTKGTENRQALCLAFHWMQQAARNGDEVAKRRLAERKECEQLG